MGTVSSSKVAILDPQRVRATNDPFVDPSRNQIVGSSKFAILDPQRVRTTNGPSCCIMQTTQMLKQTIVFIG